MQFIPALLCSRLLTLSLSRAWSDCSQVMAMTENASLVEKPFGCACLELFHIALFLFMENVKVKQTNKEKKSVHQSQHEPDFSACTFFSFTLVPLLFRLRLPLLLILILSCLHPVHRELHLLISLFLSYFVVVISFCCCLSFIIFFLILRWGSRGTRWRRRGGGEGAEEDRKWIAGQHELKHGLRRGCATCFAQAPQYFFFFIILKAQ